MRNKYVRGSVGVRDIVDKPQESTLRWYGHVRRRPNGNFGNVAINLKIPGSRRTTNYLSI